MMYWRLTLAAIAMVLAGYLLWIDAEERRAAAARCSPIVPGSNLIVCPAISITQNN